MPGLDLIVLASLMLSYVSGAALPTPSSTLECPATTIESSHSDSTRILHLCGDFAPLDMACLSGNQTVVICIRMADFPNRFYKVPAGTPESIGHGCHRIALSRYATCHDSGTFFCAASGLCGEREFSGAELETIVYCLPCDEHSLSWDFPDLEIQTKAVAPPMRHTSEVPEAEVHGQAQPEAVSTSDKPGTHSSFVKYGHMTAYAVSASITIAVVLLVVFRGTQLHRGRFNPVNEG